jgi:hypothetical protein
MDAASLSEQMDIAIKTIDAFKKIRVVEGDYALGVYHRGQTIDVCLPSRSTSEVIDERTPAPRWDSEAENLWGGLK